MELIEKIGPVEEVNSTSLSALQIVKMYQENTLTPPEILALRSVQLRIKESAWRLTEELAEVIEANQFKKEENIREEMVDCLHFLIELSIISYFDSPTPTEETPCWLDKVFEEMSIAAAGTEGGSLAEVIMRLGMSMNLLKNRPWKKTETPVYIIEYHGRLATLWQAFIVMCITVGFTSQTLYEGYFAKHQVNLDRQNNGY